MEYIIAILTIVGAMIWAMLFAMWAKGDLKPTKIRKIINKWRNK